jgi:DNA-binding NarL/FixJ family response regulator
MRVLIVDDSRSFAAAARMLLESRGYEVAGIAESATDAIEQVKRLEPAAVLLDVILPDGTGFGVAARLTEGDPELAVLLTSSEDYSSCHSFAEECGACGFVLKSQLAACDLERFWPRPLGGGIAASPE